MNRFVLAIAAILPFLPLAASRAAGVTNVVSTLLWDGRSQPDAGKNVALEVPGTETTGIRVGDTLADGTRITAPPHVAIVIGRSDGKATVTVQPGATITLAATSASGETVVNGNGDALYSVTPGALKYFRVRSGVYSATTNGAVFSTETSENQLTFSARSGTIDVTHDASVAGGSAAAPSTIMAPEILRLIDTLAEPQRPAVSYRLDEGATAPLEAPPAYQDQLNLAQQSGDDGRIAAAYNNRGVAYVAAAGYDDAIASYTKAVAVDPEYAEAYYNRGNAFARERDYDDAIGDYGKALRLDPTLEYAYNNRGLAYLRQGNDDRAIADFNEALRLDSDLSYAYNGRATVYFQQGDVDRAIADYDQALLLNPQDAYAYDGRGSAYHRKGDDGRAIADYGVAMHLDPGDPDIYYNRGEAVFARGDDDRAIADFGEALRFDPNLSYVHLARGRAYDRKGDDEMAIADYDEALRLNPTSTEAYDERANAYEHEGDYRRAIVDYGKAIRRDDGYADAYFGRAIAYLYSGSAARGRADFERFAKLVPTDAFAALWLDVADRRSAHPSGLARAAWRLDMNAWPAPLVRLFLGDATPAAVLAAAGDPNPAKQRGQLCQADFYSAEFLNVHGAPQEDVRVERRAVSECPHTYLEWTIANAALRARSFSRVSKN